MEEATKKLDLTVISTKNQTTILDVTSKLTEGKIPKCISSNWRTMWIRLPNLSPPKYSHDLSFWLPSKGYPAKRDLVNFFWRFAGDFVTSLEVIDETHVFQGRHSLTLRLGYQCWKFAMSPDLLWSLHLDVLGKRLEREFDIEIR